MVDLMMTGWVRGRMGGAGWVRVEWMGQGG